jgi:hypothetical protein
MFSIKNNETTLDFIVIGIYGFFGFSGSPVCHNVMIKRAELL